MLISRARALALLASAAAASGCGRRGDVSVGSKNFTEQLILGEMYAQILEGKGLVVTRKLDLGGTQIALASLQKGEIDMYPEYTGTALITVLHRTPSSDENAIYSIVKSEYERQFRLTWLDPAPMNNTQALATTQDVARRYHLRTLSDLSVAAPQLRLGAIPEFTRRDDALPGLQRVYGGFRFKEIRLFDIGLKYRALETGNVDVVVAFGTDGQIEADHLIVLVDDKHFWPPYHVAPVVRDDTLRAHPAIATYLNPLAPKLTDQTMRRLNYEVDGNKREPADVAREFLKASGLA